MDARCAATALDDLAAEKRAVLGAPAPPLEVSVLDGGRWRLSDARPPAYTGLVFYRGRSCGACSRYLPSLQAHLQEYEEVGVEIVAVSADRRDRAEAARRDWGLDFPIGYDLDVETMRRWGLFMTRNDPESQLAPVVCEPALALIDPRGMLFYIGISSAPFGRVPHSEVIDAVRYFAGLEEDPPVRGGFVGDAEEVPLGPDPSGSDGRGRVP